MFVDFKTGQTTFTPSDLSDSIACDHLFAQKVLRSQGKRDWPDSDGGGKLVRQKGEQHELDYLESLRQQGLNVVEIEVDDRDWGPALDATERAVADPSVDVIFQAHLAKGRWRGRADFLERNRSTGLFEVVDTKLARSVKPYMVLQLCFYSDALADLQGELPELTHVELGNGERETLKLREFIHYYRAAQARMEAKADGEIEEASTYPWPVAHCAICPLNEECEQRRRDDDHLTLVAGVGRGQVERFASVGIDTVDALAKASDSDRPERMTQQSFERIQRQASLQKTEPPAWHLLDPEPGRGFALLPAPDPGDIFYDIEGDPLWDGEGSLEYLHGLWLREDGEYQFRAIWSHDRVAERAGFEELIDLFTQRLADHPGMHIYHYAQYEVHALKRLAQTYGTREDELDELLRANVFVDLLRVVTQSLQASVENYSIKSMEKFYMGTRTADVKEGGASIEEYERWRETGDQSILDDIGKYNEEDCVSTQLLRDWLLERKAEAIGQFGLGAIKPTTSAVEDMPEDGTAESDVPSAMYLLRLEEDALREQLLGDPDEPTPPDDQLLADLLWYHRREAKPTQWAVFDRSAMSREELIEDRESLGGLTPMRGGEPLTEVKQSYIYRFTFEPQSHRFKAGDTPLDQHTRKGCGTIHQINDSEGWLEIKRGKARAEEPLPDGLIPEWPIRTTPMEQRLVDLAQGRLAGRSGGAAMSMLSREAPFGDRHLQGASDQQIVDRLVEMDGSHLMIQGPPGTGKTTRGAKLITELIARGKRVGVMANSHAAVDNLFNEVLKRCDEAEVELSAFRKTDKPDTQVKRAPGVRVANDNESALDTDYRLVGGTAWLFSREDLRDQFDFLFIDEAGQVSMANAIASSSCAQTVVLLGDPAQLAQVTQGVHPNGSGLSIMEHLLGDHLTVPPDRGIFLERTWRLHPRICSFVSEAFYDARLESERPDADHFPQLGSGLRTLLVSHDGNTLESEEEGEAIVSEIDRLVETGVSADEIMVVAAYNAQVDLMRPIVQPGVRVGTVDMLQGQQADVVFYSLAASSADDAPRGVPFLFSPNRFNVAISRARHLAYLVGSPKMLSVDARSVADMRLANRVCAFADHARSQAGATPPA